MTHPDARTQSINRVTNNTWALVLAAGEGSRLHSLTTTSTGVTIPKQFCSLTGGSSLLDDAVARGLAITQHSQVCAVVAAQHRRWWEEPLSSLPMSNLIVQPENRGTANGILLPLLHIMERDPDATIVLLPSDHHVQDETLLADSLRRATALLNVYPNAIFTLGIEPDEPDPELGYIVPEQNAVDNSFNVSRFVEKPALAQARELINRGALWNAFIIAAKARALLSLFEARIPDIVMEMQAVVRIDVKQSSNVIATIDLYTRLPTLDFSRHIMQGQEARLRVMAVPQCGWSDLGTPKRVSEALHRVTRPQLDTHKVNNCIGMRPAYLSLAAQHSLHQQLSAGL